jgi:hypothetical protein
VWGRRDQPQENPSPQCRRPAFAPQIPQTRDRHGSGSPAAFGLPRCGKHRPADLVPLGLARAGQYAISSTPAFRWGETVAKPEYWLRLSPWSWAALFVAVAALVAAIAMRFVLTEFGMSVYFAPFLPAILATALLAGVPAAAFTSASSVIIVWWAFLPPAFEFAMPSRGELHAITLFVLSTVLLTWFGHLCRMGLRMRKEKTVRA